MSVYPDGKRNYKRQTNGARGKRGKANKEKEYCKLIEVQHFYAISKK